MLVLALDTSTRQASVALCSEAELLGEYTWHVGNNHSVELLDRISRLLSECDGAMQDIDAIAVATGPGSFNGVRVAVATAKALTFALNKSLVGVSTLDIIAAQQQEWHGPICPVIEAGRSELYAACYVFDEYSNGNGEITYAIRQLSDYLLLSPQALSIYLQEQVSEWVGVPGERELPSILFCGELTTVSREALHKQMQDKAFFINNIFATRHASTLAMLALQRLQEGKEDDSLLLEPLYLRRPSITTSVRKQPLFGVDARKAPTDSSNEEGRREGTAQPQSDAINRVSTKQENTERGEGALRH